MTTSFEEGKSNLGEGVSAPENYHRKRKAQAGELHIRLTLMFWVLSAPLSLPCNERKKREQDNDMYERNPNAQRSSITS